MKRYFYYVFLMTLLPLFVSCTDDDDESTSNPGDGGIAVVFNPACDDYTYQLTPESSKTDLT